MPVSFDLGSLVGGIGSSLVGGLFNMFGASQSNELQRAMFNASMNFQEQEAEKNRAFQNEQRWAQNNWNENMYERNYLYNLPSTQVKNLRDAGINPSAMFAGASASPVGSTTAPSAVSGGSGSMPSGVSIPQMQNPFAAFANISSVIKDLADAGKLGAETKRLNTLLPKEVENYVLQNKDLEYSNELKSYDAYVSKNIKDSRIRSAWQELTNLQLKAINTQSETDLNKAKAASERLSQLLTDEDINLKKAQVVELGIRNRNLQRAFDSQFETAKSEQERNYAQASEAREQAKTISDLRGWQVGYQQAIGELAQVDSYVKRNTMWQQCESYLSELRAKSMLPEQVEQAIINAKKTNDWFVVNQLLGVVNTGVKAYGTVKGAKTGQQFVDAQDVRNNIQQEYNEYLKSKDWTPQWRRSNGVPY